MSTIRKNMMNLQLNTIKHIPILLNGFKIIISEKIHVFHDTSEYT